MSSFLYGLGRSAYRRRHLVLAAWLVALVVLGGLASAIRGEFDEKFSVPGTESQAALDSLGRTFPQAGGVTAQLIVVAPDGGSVRDAPVRKAIEAGVDRLNTIEGVDAATSPFDKYAKGVIANDGSAAIIMIGLEATNGDISATTFGALENQTDRLQASIPGSEASIGGEAYNDNRPGFSIVEAVGVVVALIVLLLTLGSLRAAGMPLLTALLGVAITMLLIVGATGITTVSSTTPLLAVMLGLAVGIDYALFIVSRHREQLAGGMEPEESAAQALATAGSAVVFAGLTVMIALIGLAVARIPFLTTMGVAASVGVLVAVLIALTLLPSLLGFAGARLRPKPRASRARHTSTEWRGSGRFARAWVRFITKVPVITIVLVIAALATLAYPAKDLRIALPSNGVADPGTPARVTYDLISDHFGPGYNGPLIVSATIVGSDDPLGVMDGIADEIRELPGVASVPLATPNENADTGIIQVIPRNGPDTQETKDLVRDIRSRKAHFEDVYDVPVYVTGYTAVAIDVSDRLGRALLPFGLLVVGLSLILLTMVFRSIAVPIKATLGYLLSVGAAFGVTAVVFEWGWFSSVFNVAQTAPVISFLPILLMGILFGLAMDYEVFLVSRIREAYVHSELGSRPPSAGGNAQLAIEEGFVSSSRVVVAAAVIMFSVFAAFVPEGEGPIKTIAFGLAVGVFIDAFIVRMTLVPAVLALLGKSAWWLPLSIDRRLPSFDVEGAALTHQLSLATWPATDDQHLIVAEGLQVTTGAPIDMAAMPRDVVVVEGPADSGKTALMLTLAGRMRIGPGKVKVAGLVLPEQAAAVRRRTGYLDCVRTSAIRPELREILAAKPAVIFVDHADRLTAHDERAALASLLDDVVVGSRELAVVLAVRDRSAIADLTPAHVTTLTLDGVTDLARTPR
ncbi:MAG TPA: MMPL family transporter [Propionibacteriaceae bacterium]|nr:MMPL family transporter [Propionibacteriaceae bacterium]